MADNIQETQSIEEKLGKGIFENCKTLEDVQSVLRQQFESVGIILSNPESLNFTLNAIDQKIKEIVDSLSEEERMKFLEQQKEQKTEKEKFSETGVFSICNSFDEIAFTLFEKFRDTGLNDSRGCPHQAETCWQWCQTVISECEEGARSRWSGRAKRKILNKYCGSSPERRVLTKNQGFRAAVARAVENFFEFYSKN